MLKKISSIALALLLLISVIVVSLADAVFDYHEDGSYDVTINEEDGFSSFESYDKDGNLIYSNQKRTEEDGSYTIKITNEDGSTSFESYDEDGNLIYYSSRTPKAEGGYIFEEYRSDGSLIRRIVANADTSSREEWYDENGKLKGYAVTNDIGDGKTQVETFDPDGNLIKREIYKDGELIEEWNKEDKDEEDEDKEEKVKKTTDIWYPHSSVCTVGLSMREMRPELTKKWYNVTPVDLRQDGDIYLELCAGRRHIIGYVKISVRGDKLTLNYEYFGTKEGLAKVESEFFTFFNDLDSIKTLEPDEIGEGFKFGQELSIENDLGGNRTPILFVRNLAAYRDEIIPGIKLKRLWPNHPQRKQMKENMLKLIAK